MGEFEGAYEVAARHSRLHLGGLSKPPACPPPRSPAMQNPQHELFLSVISLWEMQLKIQLGKLHFNLPLPELIEEQQLLNGIKLLTIKPEHIYALSQLPFHHKDPFDRLLIAQALTENLPLVSDDT